MYRIDRTDPNNIPITVDMSTTKNQAGLTWVGQFHSRYGEILHENTLKLLENFASNNPPEINDDAGLPFNKLNGMLWYDTNEDHTGFGNLKIQNGRLPAANGGWKRLEIIISPTLPTTHTFGEVTYLTQTKTLAISRGSNWDDITVKKAIDSELLDGKDSTQFLRRDVSDSLLATVHTSEVLPRVNMTYNLGSPSYKYRTAYFGTLITEDTNSLIPTTNNTYVLGNSARQFKEINVVLTKSQSYTDIYPLTHDANAIGTSDRRWNTIHVKTVNGGEFNNIYPINSTVTLGKIDNRWNAGYFNLLDTVSTRSLIPESNNVQDLGSSSRRFRQLDVNLIKSTSTENLTPILNSIYDLGSGTNKYRAIYVDNLYGGLKYRDDINFDITMSAKSKGITWTGLTDTHQIYVEETIGSEQTNLVIHNQDNLNQDAFIVRQSSGATIRDVMEVKYSNIILRAENLKNIGTLEIESAGKGCRQKYNSGTGTLEFIFY